MAIDPRAFSTVKLTPPSPLPHVSRKALQRVMDPMPIPTCCQNCGGAVELVNNIEIYQTQSYGDWPYAYRCVDIACDSFIGLHPDTDLPLGTLADRPTRFARKTCKKPFERIWRGKLMTRKTAYRWLANALGIQPSECHFGLFDVERCHLARDLCEDFLEHAHAS